MRDGQRKAWLDSLERVMEAILARATDGGRNDSGKCAIAATSLMSLFVKEGMSDDKHSRWMKAIEDLAHAMVHRSLDPKRADGPDCAMALSELIRVFFALDAMDPPMTAKDISDALRFCI